MIQDTSSSNNPLANVAAPPQPQGAQQPQQGGNPLARIAPQLGGSPQPQPAPTKAQTTAAVLRFGAIQQAMRAVMDRPDFGKSNIRPALLDEGSKLLGSKILSLPELMNSIKDMSDEPLEQKTFIQGIFNQAKMAEASVLDHHGAAIVAGKLPPDGGGNYDADDHEQHIAGLMGQYQKA